MWIAPSLRIGMAVLATFTVWLTPWSESHVREVERPAEPFAFTFRTESDAALTEWALGRFEQAGLELPPLAIAFHDDKAPCEGHPGLFRSSTPLRIDICGFNWNRFIPMAKKTILHEFGHAWAYHTLNEETRIKFIQFRSLTTWGNEQTPWDEQGFEHAAEVIAWALMDRDLFLVTLANANEKTFAEAYQILTDPGRGSTRHGERRPPSYDRRT